MAGRPIRISILANGSQARREVQGFGSTLKKAFGAAAALGVGVGVVKTFKDITTAASDAQQSLGATESVFKKYADTVVDRSEKAAESIGLSANEYRELSNVSGAMLKSSGMPLRKIADLTDKLNRRAADMAATFGGTTADAVSAVSSLLRGEADPIERYGVSIKQSDVNARLAAKGLDKLTGKAKKQAEQTERLAALFEQTSDSAGQFAKESNTLAGQQQRLSAKVENLKAKLGTALLPVLTDAAELAGDKLVPALEDLFEWVGKNSDEFAEAGAVLKSTLLPPLGFLADTAQDAAEFLGDLPGPVKRIGVEAALAALVLPRLAAGAASVGGAFTIASAKTRQFVAEMSYAETRAATLRGALTRLNAATRAAAGVGGMVLLAEGSQNAGTKLGALETVAGGVALGFSVGGPWGAAIGAGAGAMKALGDATGASREEFRKSLKMQKDYRGSLDQTTAAITRQTRETILQNLQADDTLTITRAIGLADRDVVGYVEGRAKATERVTKRVKELTGTMKQLTGAESDRYFFNKQRSKDFLAGLKLHGKALSADQKALLKTIAATKTWGEALKGLPKGIKVALENKDYKVTLKEVQNLAKEYDRNPKKLVTRLEAAGVKVVKKQAEDVKKSLEDVGKAKPKMGNWEKYIRESLKRTDRDTDRGVSNIVKALSNGTAKAKPNLGPFSNSFGNNLASLSNRASSGGNSIGSNLGAGIRNGIALWTRAIAGAAIGAVRNAVAGARAEAQIKSPSRKIRKVGEQMGAGLHQGLQRSRKKARTEGQRLMQAVLKGVQNGSSGTDKAWDKVARAVRRNITGKKQAAREAKYLKGLRDEEKALNKNARAQDRLNRRLDRAKTTLKAARQAHRDYARTIRDSFVATGNVTTLGQNDDGTVSTANLIDQLKTKVNQAKRFASLIRSLTKQGLNKTSIQQMLTAGPDAALATAEAITYGGTKAVKEINTLQKQLAAQGGSLGKTMADEYHSAGVQAAAGLVRGLNKKSRRLDRAAKRLAKTLVKAVRKELGIKSPSRVFAGIGENVIEGLRIGLDDRDVRRQGSVLATSLQRGFGVPALQAYTPAAAGPSTVQVTVNVPPTANKAEIGREIQSTLDAYYKTGGRRAA